MLLYNAFTHNALIQCITHKTREKTLETAILLTFHELKPLVENSELYKIFDKIIYAYPFFANKSKSIKECEQQILIYYDNLFKEHKVNIDELMQVYTACDMNHEFGIYLSLKNKEYYFYEIHPKQLCNERYKVYKWHIENENVHGTKEYFECQQKHLVLCGNNKLVIKKICYKESLFYNKYTNYKEFDFNKELKSMAEDIQQIVLDLYKVPRELYGKQNAIVLLTQRQWLVPISKEETGVLYQYLTDYLFSENINLIVKPHPSDTYNHKNFFGEDCIVLNSFPAELLAIIPKFNIDTSYTISSTSISKLKDVSENTLMIGDEFFYCWKYINKLVCAYHLIKKMNLEGNVYRYGIVKEDKSLELVRTNFLKEVKDVSTKYNDFKKNIGKGIILVGEIEFNEKLSEIEFKTYIDNISSDTIIIFLDFNKTFNKLQLCRDFLEVEIKKIPMKKNIYDNLENEYIYIYSKKYEILNEFKTFIYEKELKYTGIKLRASINNKNDINKKISRVKKDFRKKPEKFKNSVENFEKLISRLWKKM